MPSGGSLGLELVDEIDDVEEPAAFAAADEGLGDRDGEVGFTGAGSADEHDIALVSEEVAAGEIANQGLVDRRIVEDEVVASLGERWLGNGNMILDRASNGGGTLRYGRALPCGNSFRHYR